LTYLGDGSGSGCRSRALSEGGTGGGKPGKGEGDRHGFHGAFLKVRLVSDRASMQMRDRCPVNTD
jgi:hypothetical protein